MTVETFCLGDMDTNAYVVSSPEDPDCWVFDCPGSPGALLQALQARGANPRGLFLTHAHVDHMAGLEDFRHAFPGTPVWQHRLEESWLFDPTANLSAWTGLPTTARPAEGYLVEGQVLSLGAFCMKVLHVPGHSPGSLAYWIEAEGELFSGDVLFRSGVGRWDFPGCDRDELRRSLARLSTLPDDVRVRPGHGGSTTVGREKTSNPYLRSEEPWL